MAQATTYRRALAFLMATALVAGCSFTDIVPPAPIDRGTRVSAIQPSGMTSPVQSVRDGYPVPPQPVTYLQGGEATGVQTGTPGHLVIPEGGVNMDAELGVTPPDPAMAGNGRVLGLAEEQQFDIAEGNAVHPVVDGIGTDTPVQRPSAMPVEPRRSEPRRLEVRRQPGAGDELLGPVTRRAPPERRDRVAAAPRWSDNRPVVAPSRVPVDEPFDGPFDAPMDAPMAAPPLAAPRQVAMVMPQNPAYPPRQSDWGMSPIPEPMPASEIACRRELVRLGVQFRDKPRIYGGPSCGIEHPVELTGLAGNIGVRPGVTLNCQTTLAFAQWVRNELAPAARARYLTGVRTIEPLGGYSCRRMNNSRQAYNPMSEHARGNAIDVGKFVLKNGHEIDVRQKGFFAFRERGLLNAVRSDSCRYFNTVLGPGSNPEHWNHFHFDLRNRASGNRICD
ncbi:extensin family protein [Rhizobium straminoryzae]|uniref:Extensin n=1 Tax=Rhizobium straminoryzae TaxID=1387186 RepID=A0A549T4Q2_9HYPH|nr:extensin family protein [Rhizobium straminoryzae]TRL36861.1 extensin [Rhizobium straminoryzae]